MNMPAVCREGISSEVISAWGDGGLNSADATYLRAHIPTCASCQTTYTAYRNLDMLIRAQRVPLAPPTDVAAILAGEPTTAFAGSPSARQGQPSQPPQRPQPPRRIPRAVWGGIGAALAVAVLIVAFAQVFTRLRPHTPVATVTPRGTVTPGATATATIMTAPTLPFQQVYLPSGYNGWVGDGGPGWGASISPLNGNEAWVCGGDSNGTVTLWQSLDSMASWKVVATLTPPQQTGQIICDVELDHGDENAALLNLSWNNGGGSNTTPTDMTYYSTDNGGSWTQLPNNLVFTDIATINSTTYAMLYHSASNTATAIVSHDHLASWQTMATPSTATGASLVMSALAGANELLWYDPNGQAYHSSDGGANWTPIGSLQGHTAQLVAVMWLAHSSQWKLCASANTQASGNGVLPTFGCTTDFGATWTIIPQLTSTWECAHCGDNAAPKSGVNPCFAYQMTGDGTLYDVCGNDPQDTSLPSTSILMRYSPGSQVWTVVGGLPASLATITPTGQLWCLDPTQKKAYFLEQF